MSTNEYFLWTRYGQVTLKWALEERPVLQGIHWEPQISSEAKPSALQRVPGEISKVILNLKSYFNEGIPLDQHHSLPWDLLDQKDWSPFQAQVYRTIVRIPHGETRTYGWVAYQMGNGAASRAVGQALRKNPFPILIPCHRVVSTQSLGGFMGSSEQGPELNFKKSLIEIEDSYRQPMFSFVLNPFCQGAACV